MSASLDRIVWVGVEPTPYLLYLQQAVRERLEVEIDAVFDGVDRSQPWGLEIDARNVVGGQLRGRLDLVRRVLVGRPVLVVEGWSTPSALLALGLGRLTRRSVYVSSDTWTSHSASRWKVAARKLVLRLFVLPADGAFVAGTRHRAHMLDLGVPESRVHVVPMAVDAPMIRSCTRSSTQRADARHDLGCTDEQVVLYVGRLVPSKGIETLLAAVRQLPEGVRALFVGDGPLAGLVEAEPRASWLGRRTGTALWRCYAAADVLVLASEREPWGLVVNEAAAAGVPVIVSDAVGAGPDLVGDPARTVPVGDERRLAAAIESLAVPGRAEVAVRCQDRRLASFGIDAAVNAIAGALGHGR